MNRSALESLRRETRAVLRRHTAEGENVALLDFPTHHNSGDSLIYTGQAQYFHDLGVGVDYTSDVYTHNDALLRERVQNRTIFLQGGGNFGDRWPIHQEFREGIVARFPDNKIVGLPQGIDYLSSDALEKTASIYAGHRDLTLMLREKQSYEIALTHFPENNVEYCPDMAFGTQIAHGTGGAEVDVVKLLRVDSERVDRGTFDTEYSSVTYDWGLHGMDQALWHALTVPTRIAHNYPRATKLLYPALARSYPRMADLNLARAQHILGKGSVVLTDRLHATVLAAMMGKQVVAMDNANKKVSRIYSAYLSRFDNVRFAGTTAEAMELLATAVASSRKISGH